MKFGVHLGSRGVAGHPDSLTNVARKGEALGFTHLGISDHVVVATAVNSRAVEIRASGPPLPIRRVRATLHRFAPGTRSELSVGGGGVCAKPEIEGEDCMAVAETPRSIPDCAEIYHVLAESLMDVGRRSSR
jgi:hypothetical protein